MVKTLTKRTSTSKKCASPGASFPMPVIINPKNTEAWKKENQRQQKHFEIIDILFDKPCAQEGEQIKITVLVEGIADGNPLTLQIWGQDQDPNSHIPLDRLTAVVKDSKAEVLYCYNLPNGAQLPEDDLTISVTVHSAWCPPKQSGELTIELRRPEVTEIKCLDKDGNKPDDMLAGETYTIEAGFNEDTKEGAGVMLRVYREGSDPKRDKPVYEVGTQNLGGKATTEWKAVDTREAEDRTELKYFFTATTPRAAEKESDLIPLKNPQVVEMKWEPEVIYQEEKAKLHITTFEVAEYKPKVKIQFWKHGKAQPESLISEQELTIDKDEIEVEFTSECEDTENETGFAEDDYTVETIIVCDTLPLKPCEQEFLIVGADKGKE